MKKSIILSVAFAAGIFSSCNLFSNGEEEEPKVKITPMFSAKVQQYDMLGDYCEGYAMAYKEVADSTGRRKIVYTFIDIEGNEIPQCQYQHAVDFSEGLAAVMKDGKYGFINTKGEVVIPFNYGDANCFSEGLANVQKDGKYCYINKEGVEVISIPQNEDEYVEPTLTPFSEDVAFVIKPQGWDAFEYYAIDKTGKKLYEGTIGGWCAEEGGRFQSEYLPKFSNGEVYIPATDYDTYDVYNKQGQKLRTEKGKPNNDYEIITQTDTIGVSLIFHSGLKEIRKDSTDTKPLVNIPAIYDKIHEFKNGVALVCLYKYYEDPDTYGDLGGEAGYAEKVYYGYVDLDGNDTFSQEVKEICKQSLEKAKSKYADYNTEQNNPTWLDGTWRSASDEGYVYKIFDNGKCTTYFDCYSHVQEDYYSIYEGRIIIEGSDVSMILDCTRDIVITEGGCEWTKISNSTTIDSQLQGAGMSTDSYSNSNSYSNSSYSNTNTLSEEDERKLRLLKDLNDHETEYGVFIRELRSGSVTGNPVRLMFLKQNITRTLDDIIYTARQLGDSEKVSFYKRQKQAFEAYAESLNNW